MRPTLAICAAALSLAGCALAHERGAPIAPVADASLVVDAAPTDAARVDAAVEIDAGPPTSCTERWMSLPYCPAEPATALGQPCENEGQLCGVACCEPSPALACTGGVWVAATPPDCRGVDCAAPIPCGAGACARGRVCVSTSSEVRLPGRCVEPPFAVSSCGDLPSAWLTEDPSTCMQCLCAGMAAEVSVSLECACCDR